MAIKDMLMDDLKAAMKAKDTVKKSTITMLRAAIKQREVDERIELTDEDVIAIIAKQIKIKRGAIEDFKKAERQDMVDEAIAEIAVLETYLPKQMSQEEIAKVIDVAIEKTGASTMKDMGKVMGMIKDELVGKADNSVVASLVKQKLS